MSEERATQTGLDNHRWVRWAVSGGIVVFWAAMMVALVTREIWPRRYLGSETIITPEQFLKDWRDFDETMEIFYQGVSLGVVESQIRKLPTGAFLASARLRIVLPLGPLEAELRGDGAALLDSHLTLEEAALDCQFARERWRVETSVSGDYLYYMSVQNGQARGGRALLQTTPSFFEAMRSLLVRRFSLQVGETYAVPVFDPLWNVSDGVATAHVLAREKIASNPGGPQVEVFKIVTQFNGITTYSWVDDLGRTLRQEISKDLVFVRVERATAEERFPDLAKPATPPTIDRRRMVEVAGLSKSRPGVEESILRRLQTALRR